MWKIILVPVAINGFPPMRFILDTGASVTVLKPAAAERIGAAILPNAPTVDLKVVGGRTVSVPLARVKTVKVGELIVEDMDLGIFEAHPDVPEVAGLLGGDFLDHFNVTVDRQARRLTLSLSSDPEKSATTETTSPVTISCPKGAVWTGKGCIAEELTGSRPQTPPSRAQEIAKVVPSSVMVPTWERGYEWKYRWSSPRGSGTFVWTVVREEIISGVPHYVLRTGAREIYYTKDELAWLMDRLGGDLEVRSTPAEARFVWPLAVGTQWETKVQLERPLQRTTEERRRVIRVEAWEAVTVPAGTFGAFHIVVKDPTGRTTSEAWFAPVVSQIVKDNVYFDYGVRERVLLEYKLK